MMMIMVRTNKVLHHKGVERYFHESLLDQAISLMFIYIYIEKYQLQVVVLRFIDFR